MGERISSARPGREDHSIRVYAAIIGQKPAVSDAEPGSNGTPGHQTIVGRLLVPRWAKLQRTWDQSTLAPRMRARLTPLLERVHKRWEEGCDRLLHRTVQQHDHNPSAAAPVDAGRRRV